MKTRFEHTEVDLMLIFFLMQHESDDKNLEKVAYIDMRILSQVQRPLVQDAFLHCDRFNQLCAIDREGGSELRNLLNRPDARAGYGPLVAPENCGHSITIPTGLLLDSPAVVVKPDHRP